MENLLLYTITGCSKCHRVKKYLEKSNLFFEEVNITENPDRAEEVNELLGEFYVPILLLKDRTVIKGDNLEKIEKLIQS
jgi:glutaredoxin